MSLHSQFLLRIGARTSAPALTINIYRRVDLVYHSTYLVHRFDVVNAHEVEAEAVDMILLNPILHALLYELAHERLLARRLVAATRTVRILALRSLAVEVVGVGLLEVRAVDVERMIVHHVEYDANASLVQRLHHLLELAYACCRRSGVGRVGAFGHVIVERIVSPVVLRHVGLRLIHGSVVERRQNVHGVHAETLQVLDSLRLCERKKLALVLQSRREVDGEVAVVHLVDDEVARIVERRAHIAVPTLRVGVAQVDDGAALSVHTHRLCEYAGCVVGLRIVVHAEEIILAFQVALHR